MRYNPPHEVRDTEKLSSMINALKSGQSLPPIIVCGEVAFSGSHRIAAHEKLWISINTTEITDNEIRRAMLICDLDPDYDEINDFQEFENALKILNIIKKD